MAGHGSATPDRGGTVFAHARSQLNVRMATDSDRGRRTDVGEPAWPRSRATDTDGVWPPSSAAAPRSRVTDAGSAVTAAAPPRGRDRLRPTLRARSGDRAGPASFTDGVDPFPRSLLISKTARAAPAGRPGATARRPTPRPRCTHAPCPTYFNTRPRHRADPSKPARSPLSCDSATTGPRGDRGRTELHSRSRSPFHRASQSIRYRFALCPARGRDRLPAGDAA